MNKTELIDAVSEDAEISKSAAGRAIDALTANITKALATGESVVLVGFGTFSVKHRAARAGRNPSTGAAIEIQASTTPAFKPGKTLKDAVK